LREVVPPIGPLVPRAIAGRRIGVVADPALAEALCSYLAELGAEVVPPLVRCRREESVAAALRGPRPGGVRPHDPSLDSLGAWVRAAGADGPLDLVVGSSRERELLKSSGVPFLELGYPSVHWRPLVAAPNLGFAGALHLAHRISNRLADTGFERMARDKA